MECPYCGGESQVKDSRTSSEAGRQTIRRRRECTACKRRFTTKEQLGAPSIKVQKRDGHHEPFEPDKIVWVLGRVCSDRPGLGPADHQRLARKVEAELLDEGVKTIRSGEIVERLLRLLSDVDRLAHDRLATDYLDENGRVRTDPPRPASGHQAGQLGLPGMIDEEEAHRVTPHDPVTRSGGGPTGSSPEASHSGPSQSARGGDRSGGEEKS